MKLAHCRGDGPHSSWPALNSFPDGAAAVIDGLEQQGIFPEK